MRFLVLTILVLLSSPAVATDYLGKVLAVSDGDTFTMESGSGSAASTRPTQGEFGLHHCPQRRRLCEDHFSHLRAALFGQSPIVCPSLDCQCTVMMAPHFITILTGCNLPKIRQAREPEPSIINEKTLGSTPRKAGRKMFPETSPASSDYDAIWICGTFLIPSRISSSAMRAIGGNSP
jgi:hypothetical protein